MTEWRGVADFEGLYEVSDDGRVRSLPRIVNTRNPHGPIVRLAPGRILKPAIRNGYVEVSLRRPGCRPKILKIHRLVLESFVAPCPVGQETRHLNGDSQDNRVRNLKWGTSTENAYDRVLHGTHCKTSRQVCPRKHQLGSFNLDPSQFAVGRRSCWACRIARDLGRTATRRGREFDLHSVANEVYAKLQAGWRPRSKTAQVR